jgi:hypothetical protein
MSKQAEATCDDCYFRRSGLCALVLDRPCPTFRHYNRGALVPPPQARLIPQTVERLAARPAAA